MIWILFIFLLALIPALLSLILIRKAKQRFNRRLRGIHQRHHSSRLLNDSELPSYPQRYIGDITCLHNACSPYLRCAINPYGPCETCSSYEKR